MNKPVQKRTLETRARLIAASVELVRQNSFEALRVEEVVRSAGVAKGTFFAHFKDKEALMELLIGERIDEFLDKLESTKYPTNSSELASTLMPLYEFMTSERYVFDIIIRYSGAAKVEEIGPIAATFERIISITAKWFSKNNFRTDLAPDLLAEGIQAFSTQAMALNLCALHENGNLRDSLLRYFDAWLNPKL